MWEIWQSYNHLFPTVQALIADTLFNQGYRRWRVQLHVDGHVYTAPVWARDAAVIKQFYMETGVQHIEIEPLPLGRFDAHKESRTNYSGDVILSDEVIEAQRKRIYGDGTDGANGAWNPTTGGL